LSSQTRAPVLSFKCPKCGRVEKYTITEEDLREIKVIGIARLGFIHGDHTLIINFDPTGFIRGAYVVSSDEIPSDVRTYFKGYRIVSRPRIKSEVEMIVIDESNKTIDVRMADVGGKDIVAIMNYLEVYGKTIRHMARRVGISGKSYNIMSRNNMIVIFSKISSRHMGLFLEHVEGIEYNPFSAAIALKYLGSKGVNELEIEETRRRLGYLLKSSKVLVRAKKGMNAIRFARASIIALWPELEDTFDTIIRDKRIMSGGGMTLFDIISRNPDIDIDKLLDMLRELKKRDLIEIVEE